jgi:glycosyltransferase involved in cell wall biosynthesis
MQGGDPSAPAAPSPRVTVVIPVYNEADRMRVPLAAVEAYLRAQPYTAEIVVVDDGSDDRTFDVVREASGDGVPVRAFRYTPNLGKGHAIKLGIAHARGELILFTDVDLSTPIEEAGALLARLEAGADVAIGSRKMPGARVLVHQSWLRESLGKGFTWLVRHVIAEVSDVTCGFKAFRHAAARDVFGRVRIYDWSFDAEALMLVRWLGYRLDEVPVSWQDRAGTKVRLVRDVLRSLLGLVRIRMNMLRGVYRLPAPAAAPSAAWESARAASAGTAARKP